MPLSTPFAIVPWWGDMRAYWRSWSARALVSSALLQGLLVRGGVGLLPQAVQHYRLDVRTPEPLHRQVAQLCYSR